MARAASTSGAASSGVPRPTPLQRATGAGPRRRAGRPYRFQTQWEVVGALNLITNLVVLWNTVYLQQVIETLRAEGVEVRDEDPARFEHLNRLGKYTFTRNVKVQSNGYRTLRTPPQPLGARA